MGSVIARLRQQWDCPAFHAGEARKNNGTKQRNTQDKRLLTTGFVRTLRRFIPTELHVTYLNNCTNKKALRMNSNCKIAEKSDISLSDNEMEGWLTQSSSCCEMKKASVISLGVLLLWLDIVIALSTQGVRSHFLHWKARCTLAFPFKLDECSSSLVFTHLPKFVLHTRARKSWESYTQHFWYTQQTDSYVLWCIFYDFLHLHILDSLLKKYCLFCF